MGIMRLRPHHSTGLKKDGHDSAYVEQIFSGLPIWRIAELYLPGHYSVAAHTKHADDRNCLSAHLGLAILAPSPTHILQSVQTQ